ncbi:MAG: hypothetical protein JW984_06690 [Deltaproteobacteria bacterium]|uniref:4Fe-4S domain-containing protein n=1 Tax=Candidatus Zymogenus saltonus TaxID=2844893 RepID=A0A9D8PPE4_9DELT|nr:hypothetical protein [Candidatus Zymogenus saltonus]
MEDGGLKAAADLMALAARTAPKSRGEDYILVKSIAGKEIEKLADGMEKFGERTGKGNFDRDAKGVRNSPVVLLIGIKDAKPLGLNCGACGYNSCGELMKKRKGPEFNGPHCAFRLLDLGIALGSAVKTASILNVDNRIMYRIGTVARDIGIVDWDYIMGIPMSATGKNIYFDR